MMLFREKGVLIGRIGTGRELISLSLLAAPGYALAIRNERCHNQTNPEYEAVS